MKKPRYKKVCKFELEVTVPMWNANKHGIYQYPKIWAKSVIFDFSRYYGPMLDAYSQS